MRRRFVAGRSTPQSRSSSLRRRRINDLAGMINGPRSGLTMCEAVSPRLQCMFVWLETALAAGFALAIFGYAGEIVFMVMALAAILLIGLIGGASSFALPMKGWEPQAIVAVDILIVTALRSWRRNISELRAKGEHVWRVILIGPAVTLILGAVAAGLADR